MNDERYKHLLSSLQEVDNYDDYDDLMQDSNLSDYAKIKKANSLVLDRLISKDLGISSKDIRSNKELKEASDAMLKKYYPELNNLRKEASGLPVNPVFDKYLIGNANGAASRDFSKVNSIRINPEVEDKLRVLGHESSHLNDKTDEYLAKMIKNNDPNIDKLYNRNEVLKAKIDEIKQDPDRFLVGSKKIDLTKEASKVAEGHHIPRVDEVDGLGKVDSGDWEPRNIKRMFAGKGLKAVSGALPLVGALGAAASISDSQASELIPLGGVEGLGKGSELESENYEDMKKDADMNSLRRQALEKLSR